MSKFIHLSGTHSLIIDDGGKSQEGSLIVEGFSANFHTLMDVVGSKQLAAEKRSLVSLVVESGDIYHARAVRFDRRSPTDDYDKISKIGVLKLENIVLKGNKYCTLKEEPSTT